MEPADGDSVQHAISSHGTLLEQHHQTRQSLMESQRELTTQVTKIGKLVEHVTKQLSPSSAASSRWPAANPLPSSDHPGDSPVPAPKHFGRDLGKCKGFLLQCSLVFEQQSQIFASVCATVSYMTGQLKGKALDWLKLFWERLRLCTFPEFLNAFKSFWPSGNDSRHH